MPFLDLANTDPEANAFVLNVLIVPPAEDPNRPAVGAHLDDTVRKASDPSTLSPCLPLSLSCPPPFHHSLLPSLPRPLPFSLFVPLASHFSFLLSRPFSDHSSLILLISTS
eukprot:15107-Pleurochrysis_carterae.AAC.2